MGAMDHRRSTRVAVLDADSFEYAVGAWLARRLRAVCVGRAIDGLGSGGREATWAGLRARVVDGKVLRGTRHVAEDGQAVHLMAVLDKREGIVLSHVDEDGKAERGHPVRSAAGTLEPDRMREHRKRAPRAT